MEDMGDILPGAIGCALLVRLFFRPLLLEAAVWLLLPLFVKECKKARRRRRRDQVQKEVMEILQGLAASVQVGYALENAWVEAYKGLEGLYGSKSVTGKTFRRMIEGMRQNIPMTQLMEEAAKELENEDFSVFTEIVGFAKRSGGNFVEIIRQTVEQMQEKMDVEREITTMVAQKKLELWIMRITPPAILLYLRLASPEYMEPLYAEAAGAAVMAVLLMGYLVAWWLGERILNICV